MKPYDVFRSEGGWRVAGSICNGGPVMSESPWYTTKRAAQRGARRMEERDLRGATYWIERCYDGYHVCTGRHHEWVYPTAKEAKAKADELYRQAVTALRADAE